MHAQIRQEETIKEFCNRPITRRQMLRAAGIASVALLSSGCAAETTDEASPSISAGEDGIVVQTTPPPEHCRSFEEVVSSGEMVVGVSSDARPYSFIDSTGNYTGFDAAFAECLAWDMAVRVRFVGTDPSDVGSFLLSNKVDVVISSTALPAEGCLQALPLIAPRQAVVAAATAGPTLVESPQGIAVGVCSGSQAEALLPTLLPGANCHVFESFSGAFQAICLGIVDALLLDQLVAKAWVRSNPGFTVVLDGLGEPCPAGLVVAPENEGLLQVMNQETSGLVSNGRVRALYSKYVVPDAPDIDPSQILLPVEPPA